MHNKRLPVYLIIILTLVLTAIPILTACSTKAPAGKQVLIRVTTPVPVGDTLANWWQEGMDRFNGRTNGAYKMQMFPGGQLANMPESLDAIRTGSVEGGVIPLAAFQGTVPEFGLAELPFLYNNGEANDYAMTGLTEVYSKILQEKCNQRSLGCVFIGALNLLSTKKEIKTLEDLQGLIVGCDTPSSAGLITALGGSGIVVDFTEDYSNLQKGVIDAKTSATQYIEIAKLYEIAKYYTVFFGLGSLYSLNINSDVYNKMPKDMQNILNEEMRTTAQTVSQNYVKMFYEMEDVLKEKGLQFYFLPESERDRWKQMAYPGTLATLKEFGDVGTKIKQISDEANTKFPYVE